MQPPIDFDRQIRPIFSENCYACHGPDEKQRKAKLRLDVKEVALSTSRLSCRGMLPRAH
jgi:Planctomycete cytochrome C